MIIYVTADVAVFLMISVVKGRNRAARGAMVKLRNAEQSRFLSVRAECE